jgi:hypothetical protein
MKLKLLGEDEIYTNWYECPECKDTNIFELANNCPNCGYAVKDFWKETINK